MEDFTLSVIMANYNHAHYIGEALKAILDQSVRPLEIIVIDDGSTDNSIEVVEEFAGKSPIIRLLRNERNMGVEFTINRGLEYALGAYVSFQSADDKMLPGFVEKLMNFVAQYPQAGLCCSDPATFDDRTGAVKENRLRLSDVPRYFYADELVKMIRQRPVWIASHTSVIKRTALLDAGKMIPELKWHCDWFAQLVIAFRNGICYIPETLAALRVHAGSYAASGVRQWRLQREVLNRMLFLLKSPAYRDVLPFFNRSGVLSVFQMRMLVVILSNVEYWGYLSPLLVSRILRLATKGAVYRIVPAAIKAKCRALCKAT